MSRTNSINILLEDSSKALLAESYGKVIDNISKKTISALIKNTELSGNPDAGSVEAKRFANTAAATYGTARSGGGTAIVARPVTVPIDVDKEIINEVEDKDVALFGVADLIARKAAQNEGSMRRDLERAFFAEALEEGTEFTFTASQTALEDLEEIIQSIETTSNAFVDGVEREMISVILAPAEYGKIRSYLDTNVNNANVDSGIAEFGRIHGVKVFSSVYLPEGCTHIAMADGAIAQPVRVTLDEAAKFPASNAYHFGLFYSYGTKCVMPDLIKVAGNFSNALSDLTVTSAAGTESGDTKITVSPAKSAGMHYVYKVDTAVTVPSELDDVSAWTAWDGTSDITAATGKVIAIVEANRYGKAKHGGKATVTAKAAESVG